MVSLPFEPDAECSRGNARFLVVPIRSGRLLCCKLERRINPFIFNSIPALGD